LRGREIIEEKKRAIFNMFQFGQDQGGSEISTAGHTAYSISFGVYVRGVCRGLKFPTNAEIGRNGVF
jgi:hypothetical protein